MSGQRRCLDAVIADERTRLYRDKKKADLNKIKSSNDIHPVPNSLRTAVNYAPKGLFSDMGLGHKSNADRRKPSDSQSKTYKTQSEKSVVPSSKSNSQSKKSARDDHDSKLSARSLGKVDTTDQSNSDTREEIAAYCPPPADQLSPLDCSTNEHSIACDNVSCTEQTLEAVKPESYQTVSETHLLSLTSSKWKRGATSQFFLGGTGCESDDVKLKLRKQEQYRLELTKQVQEKEAMKQRSRELDGHPLRIDAHTRQPTFFGGLAVAPKVPVQSERRKSEAISPEIAKTQPQTVPKTVHYSMSTDSNYNPWGRGGAGAPVRDSRGDVITVRSQLNNGDNGGSVTIVNGENEKLAQAEIQRRYRNQLQSQIEEKKKLEDEVKRLKAEEEARLNERIRLDQLKISQEFEQELKKKEEKERARDAQREAHKLVLEEQKRQADALRHRARAAKRNTKSRTSFTELPPLAPTTTTTNISSQGSTPRSVGSDTSSVRQSNTSVNVQLSDDPPSPADHPNPITNHKAPQLRSPVKQDPHSSRPSSASSASTARSSSRRASSRLAARFDLLQTHQDARGTSAANQTSPSLNPKSFPVSNCSSYHSANSRLSSTASSDVQTVSREVQTDLYLMSGRSMSDHSVGDGGSLTSSEIDRSYSQDRLSQVADRSATGMTSSMRSSMRPVSSIQATSAFSTDSDLSSNADEERKRVLLNQLKAIRQVIGMKQAQMLLVQTGEETVPSKEHAGAPTPVAELNKAPPRSTVMAISVTPARKDSWDVGNFAPISTRSSFTSLQSSGVYPGPPAPSISADIPRYFDTSVSGRPFDIVDIKSPLSASQLERANRKRAEKLHGLQQLLQRQEDPTDTLNTFLNGVPE